MKDLIVGLMGLCGILLFIMGVAYLGGVLLPNLMGHDPNAKVTEAVKQRADDLCKEYGGVVFVQVIPSSTINYETQCKYKKMSFNLD